MPTTATPAHLADTACYICGSGPHTPTALHVYTSWAEAEAWANEADALNDDPWWVPSADESLRFPGED